MVSEKKWDKSLLGLNILLENCSHTELRRLDLGVSGSLYLKNMNFGGARNAQKDYMSIIFSNFSLICKVFIL
jgi:hypothetical protein